MNLSTIMKTAIAAVFALDQTVARPGLYVRPASYSSSTGLTFSLQVTASITFISGRSAPLDLDDWANSRETVYIRATDLAGIIAPAAGDFILDSATGIRRDIVRAELDDTGQLWTFRTIRVPSLDWGDLIGATETEDWDLISVTPTVQEDWGTL